MPQSTLHILKSTGEVAPFSEERLRHSLLRSGATESTVDKVVQQLKHKLYEGITTKRIYQLAFSLLKKEQLPLAAKYKLKHGIMELGPSGFPFEKFIAEIFKTQGWHVQVGLILQGHCVQHEVDVLAEKARQVYIMECKYHNRSGYNCDVKVPLYVHARFNDLKAQLSQQPAFHAKTYTGWLVTNTQFSNDAIQYGTCSGLQLLGWNYPHNNSLQHMIETAGLYPLTCLTTLTRVEKQRLLDDKIVLCRELQQNPKLLQHIGIRASRMKAALTEIEELCADRK